MASIMIKSGVLAVATSVLESKYSSHVSNLRGIEKGLTPLLILGTGFWVVLHGFEVGKARKKYMALASKDGEADVPERYDYPNLYAQGTSLHVRAFNCVQRSHQHIFETLTQAMAAAAIAHHSYPLASAVLMALYAVGRYHLSTGYAAAEGDATKRYASSLAFFTWYGLISLHILGALSAAKMVLGDAMY